MPACSARPQSIPSPRRVGSSIFSLLQPLLLLRRRPRGLGQLVLAIVGMKFQSISLGCRCSRCLDANRDSACRMLDTMPHEIIIIIIIIIFVRLIPNLELKTQRERERIKRSANPHSPQTLSQTPIQCRELEWN